MVWGIINRGSTVNKYYLYIYYIYYIYIYYTRTHERKNDFFTFLLFNRFRGNAAFIKNETLQITLSCLARSPWSETLTKTCLTPPQRHVCVARKDTNAYVKHLSK